MIKLILRSCLITQCRRRWLSYATFKQQLLPYFQYNQVTDAVGIAICGALAACSAAIATNPLDVAKTRLQVRLDALVVYITYAQM